MRIAYFQDERQLARVDPEQFGFVRPEQRLPFTLQVGIPHKQVASENVSRFRREWSHRYSHLAHETILFMDGGTCFSLWFRLQVCHSLLRGRPQQASHSSRGSLFRPRYKPRRKICGVTTPISVRWTCEFTILIINVSWRGIRISVTSTFHQQVSCSKTVLCVSCIIHRNQSFS